ncbi:hypothetical protein RRG08_034375 [Elysia crispata]|uniref:Uncharacterized protein n=1 Tax=Elysia crispata TaxID=231223 RepID=A0AAE1CWP5_9GAST|nr:hypothetical protein RRG08_034375 [Elysia crispata]
MVKYPETNHASMGIFLVSLSEKLGNLAINDVTPRPDSFFSVKLATFPLIAEEPETVTSQPSNHIKKKRQVGRVILRAKVISVPKAVSSS